MKITDLFAYSSDKPIRVQNLIERCLQLYMSQKEVVSTLLHQAKIEPGFTELDILESYSQISIPGNRSELLGTRISENNKTLGGWILYQRA
ncbi:UNVERIFIED_CONTAM: hypothetical protein Scaly_0633600 [Sesamum calycinum]|uniref:Uncharacterized protein n=1 Tax=Sesamum calycinum TaxID=2727403 RepID=A0AAW2RVK0_9LAMI